MSLISLGVAGLSNAVDEVYANQPLLGSELNFSCKLVNVSDERREDFSLTVWAFGTDVIDHLLGEFGIELGLGRHGDGVCVVVVVLLCCLGLELETRGTVAGCFVLTALALVSRGLEGRE